MTSNSAEHQIFLAEPWLDESCAAAVSAQVLSSFVGPGRACREFSESIEKFLNVGHCVLTTSGTVALTVAAVALGLKPGDEILVPAYGVISTINAFAVLGLAPRLVDIDRRTACIDPAQLERRITASTKAICFVNFSGYTGDALAEVARIAKAHGLPLIEDAACAFGHRHDAKAAGTFGDVGTLSFSVPKVLTTGQGGALVTDSKESANRALEYIDQGDLKWRETNLNRGIGSNLRFNDVLAALGLAQMHSIEERLERKRRSHEELRDALGDFLFSVPGEQAPLQNIVFADDVVPVIEALTRRNISAVRQYRSLYQHPAYGELGDIGFPNADYWTDHALFLPFGVALSQENAKRIGVALTKPGVALTKAPD